MLEPATSGLRQSRWLTKHAPGAYSIRNRSGCPALTAAASELLRAVERERLEVPPARLEGKAAHRHLALPRCCTSHEFATFTQAINNTKQTAPKITSSIVRASPTMSARHAPRSHPSPPAVRETLPERAASVDISDRARST
jgi:hypothetical protein